MKATNHSTRKCEQVRGEEFVAEQNLYCAWEAVARNHGGPGLDRVSVEDYARRVQSELTGIREDVLAGTYKPGTLMTCPAGKPSGGTRELTIAPVRDRVLSRAIAQVLAQHIDAALAPQSYAYRRGKGALRAVSAVQHACQSADYVLRADIEEFFDRMAHAILAERLKERGIARDACELIMNLVAAPRFDGVACQKPDQGVPQGSPLSPVLSNLFLDPVDQALARDYPRFLRYADDLVIFCGSAGDASGAVRRLQVLLDEIELQLSMNKTRVYAVEKGFLFLGFIFTRTGHAAGKEARARLREKLDEGPCADEGAKDYQKRRASIVRGWEQYFGKTPTEDEKSGTTDISQGQYIASREDACERRQPDHEAVDEPEEPADAPRSAGLETQGGEALRLRRELAADDQDTSSAAYRERLIELAEHYDREGLRGAAYACRKEAGCAQPDRTDKSVSEQRHSVRSVELWTALFGYGHGSISVAYADRLGRLGYRPAYDRLTVKLLEEHWQGRRTLAVPVYGAADNVRFGVVDIDITRRTLDGLSKHERESFRDRLLEDAVALLQRAHKAGVRGVIESSGYKGYHVWFFTHQPLEARLMKEFLSELVRIAGPAPDGSHRELFPASATRPPEGLQTHVKLPLGIHRLTGDRSHWVTPAGESWPDAGPDMLNVSLMNTARSFKQAIESWSRYKPSNVTHQRTEEECVAVCSLQERCAVMNGLMKKAKQERVLSHAERMVVRGILEPLGAEGSRAIHSVMQNCEDYDRKMTERFLGRPNPKPMACSTIREVLGDFCEQTGCACRFRKKKSDYAHPLRHLTASGEKPPILNAPAESATDSKKNKESQCSAKELEEILKRYHETRRELLDLSGQIQARVDAGEARLAHGVLKCREHDPDLSGWIIEV